MPRATCAELIALSCATCLLAMPRSDRQYGCSLRKRKMKRTERGQEKTRVHCAFGQTFCTCSCLSTLFMLNLVQKRLCTSLDFDSFFILTRVLIFFPIFFDLLLKKVLNLVLKKKILKIIVWTFFLKQCWRFCLGVSVAAAPQNTK